MADIAGNFARGQSQPKIELRGQHSKIVNSHVVYPKVSFCELKTVYCILNNNFGNAT